MKLKRILGAVLCTAMLAGCTQPQEEPETISNLSEVYTGLSEDNRYVIIEKDDLKPILEHGTSVLFLGFPECVWCQAYLPMMEEILEEQDAHAEYYNIYADKKADRPFYDEIAAMIKEKDESIMFYDNDGKPVIYMPLVLFLKDGELAGYDNETCTEDSSVITPEEYWTEEKKSALMSKLDILIAQIKDAQTENDSRGCDNGCKVDTHS